MAADVPDVTTTDVAVHVPFVYDLGGPVRTWRSLADDAPAVRAIRAAARGKPPRHLRSSCCPERTADCRPELPPVAAFAALTDALRAAPPAERGTRGYLRRYLDAWELEYAGRPVRFRLDPSAAETWNLSHLASHQGVLSAHVDGLPDLVLAGVGWAHDVEIRIVPWAGTVTLVHGLRPRTAVDQSVLEALYPDLVRWKNRDYLPYLAGEAVLSAQVAEMVGADDDALADPHPVDGSFVRLLRAWLAPCLSPRLVTYRFHDFRVVHELGRDAVDRMDLDVERLVALGTHTASTAGGGGAPGEPLRFARAAEDGKERAAVVVSSGWVTVVRAEPAGPGLEGEDLRMLRALLHTAHTEWFVCQAWIAGIKAPGQVDALLDTDPEQVALAQIALAQDLAESDNPDLVLKSPAHLRVARYFTDALGVGLHRRTAEQQLEVLESLVRHAQRARNAAMLRFVELALLISAFAAVIALIPVFLAVEYRLPATLTMVVLLAATLAAVSTRFKVHVLRALRRLAGR